MIRKLLSYIPQNNLEEAPYVDCTDPIDRLEDSLNEIIPDSPNKPYDMYEVISAIVDNGEFLEVQPHYAKNIIIGFRTFQRTICRYCCKPAKNIWRVYLTAMRHVKVRVFVRFCDAFNIPLVSFGRCSGIPSRHRTRIQRRNPPRRQVAVCLRRSDCTQSNNYPA